MSFALSFFWVVLELTLIVKLRRSKPLANSGSKGGLWKPNLHAENAELTVLVGASVRSAQISEEDFTWKEKASFRMCRA